MEAENQEGQLSLDSFNMLTVIGKGSYAKVVLVRKKGEEGRVYALKILKKKYIEKKKQENHVMTERNILVGLDHPFLVKLYYSFQNEKKLFFALEYCPGGELFGLLQKKQKLSEEQTKFYAAQIVLALEYMHSKDIIYRDLKPENVLIDDKGYIRLTDFGLSKMNIIESSATSICGTPEYLAPEILYKQGHGKPMTIGYPPFFSNSRSELFDKIKFSNPPIPPFVPLKLRSLLEGLFQKKPENRLGSKGGAQEIKNHPWFLGSDWDALLNKKIKAPFVPLLKSEVDVVHFDPEFTECDVQSFTDASLKSDDGKPYHDFSYEKSPEQRLEAMQAEKTEDEFEMHHQ